MYLCQKYKEITEKVYNEIIKLIPEIKKHSESESRYHLRRKIDEFLEKVGDKRPIFLEEHRIDILIGDVVVETKKFGELRDNKDLYKFKRQTKEYMVKHISPFGILTDLNRIYFFELKDNKIVKELNVGANDFTYENFCYFLELLFGKRKKYISENALITDFGYVNNNTLIKKCLKKLFFLLKESQNKKTEMIFYEWEKLFNLAETTNKEYLQTRRNILENYFNFEINEKNEYQCLFVMHTLMSIIVKLLTFSFLMNLNKNKWKIKKKENIAKLKEFYIKIENGEIFKELGVINFCNNDFFSWYIYENWDKKLFELLSSLKNRSMLYRYIESDPLLLKDALQRLYENFIPREIRHSFGEYYTPPLVADLMVQESKKLLNKKNYRAVDPTCGSGTFLISLLKDRIINNKEKRSIREITKEVVGIDLNPIAVLMSKFNYLLTAYPYFKKERDITDIEIPVYLGDASYVPTEENIEGISCLTYEYYFPRRVKIKFPKIVFPKNFVRSESFLQTIIKIEEKINRNENAKKICKYLFDEIGNENLNQKIKNNLESLIKRVVDYQKKKLNTIWLFIFMNYLKPFALSKFDLIIGNPPWVRWAVLPYEYKEKIKKTLRQEGVFSQDRNYGGVDLNICALIAHRVIENLSNPDGVLAFLFPQGVLVNKSYEGFRNFIFGDKIAVPKLILKPNKSFFGEEPIILFLKIKAI